MANPKDPGLQVSEHLRGVISKARRSHVLPPSSKLNSPTLFDRDLSSGSAEYDFFTALDSGLIGQVAQPQAIDPILGSDFEWSQGWDFSLVDQLFSTVTEPRGDSTHVGPAFWDRDIGAWDSNSGRFGN
jgi:hypothetical protein